MDLVTDDILLQNDIKGTTQTPTYVNGDITTVTHKDSGNNVVRIDNFTYTQSVITEIRTITNGSSITFKYYFNADGSYNRTEVI